MRFFSTLLVFAFVLVSTQVFAFPTPGASDNGYSLENWSADYDFNGIAKLSNCSGSLFHFEGYNLDDKALILTNGHCVGFPLIPPGEIRHDESSSRRFELYNSEGMTSGNSVKAERLIYATMTDTDLAIYRLKQTYREIQDQLGIESLELAKNPAALEESIAIVSGYHHSVSECTLEAYPFQLKEGDWFFKTPLRYSKECHVIGGTSGSPVVSLESGKIVGVNNTVKENGAACTINNPCELDAKGKILSIPNRGYGQQTKNVYSCLDKNLQFDLSIKGCVLPKGKKPIS